MQIPDKKIISGVLHFCLKNSKKISGMKIVIAIKGMLLRRHVTQ